MRPEYPGRGGESGYAGEPVGGFKDGEVSAGGAEELRGEDGAETGLPAEGD
ncbi:hypothetical protein BJQ90_00424 [Arthrobacter sp. SO3]|nr:hypothetical protein [Arthrobacter sp. SO3]